MLRIENRDLVSAKDEPELFATRVIIESRDGERKGVHLLRFSIRDEKEVLSGGCVKSSVNLIVNGRDPGHRGNGNDRAGRSVIRRDPTKGVPGWIDRDEVLASSIKCGGRLLFPAAVPFLFDMTV